MTTERKQSDILRGLFPTFQLRAPDGSGLESRWHPALLSLHNELEYEYFDSQHRNRKPNQQGQRT